MSKVRTAQSFKILNIGLVLVELHVYNKKNIALVVVGLPFEVFEQNDV